MIKKLQQVLQYIKDAFVGKDEVIDLLGIGLLARENVFLLGPPGTAKSAIVRLLSSCIQGGQNFEYLLTRFTEPNEIFGPFDIRQLKEGNLITNTEGMLPEANMVFLDEIFNANSAILNSLLLALNERIFRRGKETKSLPSLLFVGASNLVPEEEALQALFDRFLIRVKCDYVEPSLLGAVLRAGRQLEHKPQIDVPQIEASEIRILQEQTRQVDLTIILDPYVDLLHTLRATGTQISDRQAVKLQKLIAASAIISGRDTAILADLWVLKYIWDTEEQIEILNAMVNRILIKAVQADAHPQALQQQVPNAELLHKEVKALIHRWSQPNLPYQEQNLIKDQLRFLQTRCDWLVEQEHKQFIQKEIEQLWQQILQTL